MGSRPKTVYPLVVRSSLRPAVNLADPFSHISFFPHFHRISNPRMLQHLLRDWTKLWINDET